MLSDDMKEELVRGLTEVFQRNLSAIILYGSIARGEATNESDIDIAIIIKDKIDNQTKRQFISWAAEMDLRYERVFSIVDRKSVV